MHVSRQLARYCDGQVTTDEARRIEAHLTSCERCRRERDDIRFAAGLVRQLAVVTAPGSIWQSIDAKLDAAVPFPQPARASARRWILAPVPAFAWTLAILAVGIAAYWVANGMLDRPWEVATLRPAAAPLTGRLAEGDWVETDVETRARITVGTIGTVDVGPATRVRLGAIRRDEYRIALTRGTISAEIAAPPRLFIVDTPASTVVDLGCAYTVNVEEDGRGELRVTEGWASLEWKGRESLVPAGASASIRPGIGPGTPSFDDSSQALRTALVAFDFADGGSQAVATVLAEARVRDTLTLWHLMSRVVADQRGQIYDRIAALAPPPDTVSRDKALQLDTATLKHWREELAWKW
jgi:predicted anti-sigma-YlaC factor YlaD